jgi:hypothetical protein
MDGMRTVREVCGHPGLVFGADESVRWLAVWSPGGGGDYGLVSSPMPKEEVVTMLEGAIEKVKRSPGVPVDE